MCRTMKMLVAFMVVSCVGCSQSPPPAPITFVVDVERETTHIVEPLDESGFVDYLEAANQRHGNGVSADDNWQVVVRQVFGPFDWDETCNSAYYDRLDIPRPDPDSSEVYLATLSASNGKESERKALLKQQFTKALEGPWKAEEYPELADWLEQQAVFLDRLTAGSRLSRSYSPLVVTAEAQATIIEKNMAALDKLAKSADPVERLGSQLVKSIMGGVSTEVAPLSRSHASIYEVREVARIFRARCHGRIAEGDCEGAKNDALTMHRIARLTCQGRTLEWVAGHAFEEAACMCDATVLQTGKVGEEFFRAYLEDLLQLAPLPAASQQIDFERRHRGLDALQFAARNHGEAYAALTETEASRSLLTAFSLIDWNEVMRRFNRKCDRFAAASREADPITRLRLTAAHAPQPSKRAQEVAKAMALAAEESQDLTDFMAELYFSKSVLNPTNSELRAEAHLTVVRTACAAKLYSTEHNKYPDRIEALQPILNEVPIDPFSGNLSAWARWMVISLSTQSASTEWTTAAYLTGMGPTRMTSASV